MNSEATLAKLLEGWLDESLTDADQSDLLRQLGADPQLRRSFAEQVATIGATRAAADSSPRWLALFDLLDHANASDADARSFEILTMERIEATSRRTGYSRPTVWGIAAAVALLLAGTFLYNLRKPNAVAPDLSDSSSRAPGFSAVAVVVGGSPEAGFETGTYLKPGIVSQKAGWLTIQTFKGVSVTLDAPFELALTASHDRIRLNHGRARVRVPEGAEGFLLESPAFDVLDLGTEFAAKVNDDGTGTCRVFMGKADVSLLDSIGEVKRTRRLAASESVRISPATQDLQVIEETDKDYPEFKLPPRPGLKLPSSYAADVMRMAPVGYWRFESLSNGIVANEVPGDIRLQAAGGATIAAEADGNHSGELTRINQSEYFQIPSKTQSMLQADFSISLFAQFAWLQNFAMISATRYDDSIQGYSFLLQSYAAFRSTSHKGTALNAVLRNPPAWDGGVELFSNAGLRPLRWHHIAATRNKDTVTLYLDGAVVARESVGNMPLDCRQIFVGRLNGNADQTRMEARGMVGHIDELAIFPRALTDGEIRRLGTRGESHD
jgi:hypothetical protein